MLFIITLLKHRLKKKEKKIEEVINVKLDCRTLKSMKMAFVNFNARARAAF